MKKAKCPYCGNQTIIDPSNPYRPFCSDRCRLIDLGEWADGKYTIPAEEAPDNVNQIPEDDDAHEMSASSNGLLH